MNNRNMVIMLVCFTILLVSDIVLFESCKSGECSDSISELTWAWTVVVLWFGVATLGVIISVTIIFNARDKSKRVDN